MALIKCPECGKEFSDLAKSCPNCAWPVPEPQPTQQEFPSLPAVLAIGDSTMNMYTCSIDDPSYSPRLMTKGVVILHTHHFGISLSQNFKSLYIHRSQILNINVETNETLKNKSVIGRAAVGTILLGPFGGIIGGMSGLGKKAKKTYIFFLDYFDVYSHKLCTVILSSKDDLTPLKTAYLNKSTTIGNSHYICNLKNNEGELDDARILECLQKLGKKIVLNELEKKYLRSKTKSEDIINSLCQTNGIDKESLPEKKDHGCATILLLPIILSLLFFL